MDYEREAFHIKRGNGESRKPNYCIWFQWLITEVNY